MNAVLRFRGWLGHLHIPSRDSMLRVEKMVFNRNVWIAIGIFLLVALVVLLAAWVFQSVGRIDRWPTNGPYHNIPIIPR